MLERNRPEDDPAIPATLAFANVAQYRLPAIANIGVLSLASAVPRSFRSSSSFVRSSAATVHAHEDCQPPSPFVYGMKYSTVEELEQSARGFPTESANR
jgi:hypothetical protein